MSADSTKHRVFSIILIFSMCIVCISKLCAQDFNCPALFQVTQDLISKNGINALDVLSTEQKNCLYQQVSGSQASWIKMVQPLLRDLVEKSEKNRGYDLMVSLGEAIELSPVTVFENLPSERAIEILEFACVSVAHDKIDGGANLAETSLAKRRDKLVAVSDLRWLSYRNACLGAIEKMSLEEQQRLGCLG
jgi:hypothetical protein